MNRSIKPVPAGINAGTQGQIIRLWIPCINEIQQVCIRTDACWIQRGDLGRCQDRYAARGRNQSACRRAAGIVIDVSNAAVPYMSERYRACIGNTRGIASPFVIEEEKQLVTEGAPEGSIRRLFAKQREHHWAAKASAELIAVEFRPFHSSSIIKKAVGREFVVTVVFTKRTVKIVGAALGDDLYLPAGTASFRSRRIGAYRAELLDRIDRCITYRGSELTCCLVVRVYSIYSDVALIGTGACDRPDTIRRPSTDVVSDNTRLKPDQGGRRAADLDGQFLQLPCIDHVSNTGVCRIEGVSCTGRNNIDRRTYVAGGERGVICFGLCHAKSDVTDHKPLKSRTCNRDRVLFTRWNIWERVLSPVVRCRSQFPIRFCVL